MTKDTLTLGSTDLLAFAETVEVTVSVPSPERYEHSYMPNLNPYKWNPINDPTLRQRHTVIPVLWMTLPYEQTPTRRCRCVMSPMIRKALRTYPKRMSRAKRKEARAREQRRRIKDNKWWSKR